MKGSGTEALLTALFVALFASPSVGADDVHIDLVLRGAVFRKEAPGPADPALLVDVNRSGDRWQRAWGIARSFNVAHHAGRVVAGSAAGDSIELTLEVLINGDEKFALWTVPLVEKLIAQGLGSDQFGHNVGDRAQQVAIA
jgi:hypothetical protein